MATGWPKKLFRTNNIDTVKTCQSEFGSKLPTTLLACRKETFLCKINQCDNYILRLFPSATQIGNATLCMHRVFMFALFN